MFLHLLPFLIYVCIFSYVPLYGWIYSVFEYKPGMQLKDMAFVGMKYFSLIYDGSTNFLMVFRNTLVLSGLGLMCSVIPVIFAILLSQLRSGRFSKIIQTVTSLPNFISWVLVYAIFFSMFSVSDGVINQLLVSLGILKAPVNLLGDADKAWYVQTFIAMWKTTGWSAIIYLAAIAGIDQELYDAAAADGANRFQRIIHITVPGILPTYFVLLLLAIANILSNGFEQYWVFQNALTRDKLEVFDTYVYRLGMVNMQFSFSTAMGMFKTIVSIILLTAANFASKLLRGQGIF